MPPSEQWQSGTANGSGWFSSLSTCSIWQTFKIDLFLQQFHFPGLPSSLPTPQVWDVCFLARFASDISPLLICIAVSLASDNISHTSLSMKTPATNSTRIKNRGGKEMRPRKQERQLLLEALCTTPKWAGAGCMAPTKSPLENWVFSLRFSDPVLFRTVTMILFWKTESSWGSHPCPPRFIFLALTEMIKSGLLHQWFECAPLSRDLPHAPSYFIDIWEFHTCLQLQLHTFFKGHMLWFAKNIKRAQVLGFLIKKQMDKKYSMPCLLCRKISIINHSSCSPWAGLHW